jgi:6-phosphofructokinase 2
MPAILTITFNPCIDVNVTVPALVPESKLRCSTPLLQPGGGGINVARAVRRLGGEATAIYLASGDNGKKLTRMLEEEGVRSIVMPIAGCTRESLIVVDKSSGLQYRFILPGPAVPDQALKDLPEIIRLQENVKFIVVSGSLPPGLSAGIFDMLATVAGKKGIRLVVDTSGKALQQAVAAGVYMIKPSVRELIALAGGENEKNAPVEALAKKLVSGGNCRVVVVSMGEAGALLVTEDLVKRVVPPVVKTVSTVGAGDSMVAGIVWSLSLGKGLEEAVEYGCACGTAATMNAGTTLCHREDVDILFARMHKSYSIPNFISDDQNYTLL